MVRLGEKVALIGFSGFKLGEYEVLKATPDVLEIQTKAGKVLTFDTTGAQLGLEGDKAKYPNKIVTLEESKKYKEKPAGGFPRKPKAEAPKAERIIKIELPEAPKKPEAAPKGETPKHPQYDSIKTCIDLDIPVYLVGEAGTGKNHTLQAIAGDLGLDFYFTNSIQQEYKITGFIDAGGKYHETEFYKAFKNGGLFFLDEMDASIPEVLVLLNAAIANRYFEFPIGRIDAHPTFRVVAAGNTVGSGANELYTGRLVLDSATLDRFAVIEFDYDINIELSLANGNSELVTFIRSLRDFCKSNGIRGTFSYRMIIAVTKLEAAKMPLEQVVKIAVVKGLDKDTIKTLRVDAIKSGRYHNALEKVKLA